MGIYKSREKVARFRIELGPAKSAPTDTGSGITFKFGEGKLLPEQGSDSGVLLADLQRALEAKTMPVLPQDKRSVTFAYANIGDNLSRVSGGGFDAKRPGHWTALKLFFGDGDQESQVFLNINARIKRGEFSIKDPDYGDSVLAELAKVL